jgi:hypothetical protein
MRIRIPRAGAVGLLLLGAACTEEIPNTPSPPVNGQLVVETFAGTLPLTTSRFYSFTQTSDGSIMLTLISLVEDGAPSTARVGVSIGFPAGTDCQALSTATTVSAQAGSAPQVSGVFPAGVYCARIADVGQLTSSATFVVNIARAK